MLGGAGRRITGARGEIQRRLKAVPNPWEGATVASWQAGLILLAAILVLWAVLAGGAKLVRLFTKRQAPAHGSESPDPFPSRDPSLTHGRWPDDTGR